jgi:hypothetical protein
MSSELNELKSINKHLKVVISLLLKNDNVDERNLRDQIVVLSNLNMAPKEIAEIIGRSGNYVSKELSHVRRVKGR